MAACAPTRAGNRLSDLLLFSTESELGGRLSRALSGPTDSLNENWQSRLTPENAPNDHSDYARVMKTSGAIAAKIG